MIRTQRRGLSNFVVFSVIVLLIVVGAFAYSYFGPPEGGTKASSTFTRTGTSGTTSTVRAPLISFSADAYSIEATALLSAFSRSTGIPVAPVKSGGSFADANQIAAGAPDDVFISVSLSATGTKYLKNLSSNWAVGFASDQMVLAYSNSSSAMSVASQGTSAAKSNASSDWNIFFTSLTSGSVKVGIADPVADPAGLRGWLVLEAAGLIYSNGNQSAYAAALVRAGANITGAHAAVMIAPLQSGQIQFLFIYKSAAIADDLAYLSLDRHVNLGDPILSTFYSKVSYKDSAGVMAGAPIILCVTVPKSSANPSEALQFVQYVVKNAGSLSSCGLQPFEPARLYSNTAPPTPIEQLISQGLVINAGSLQ